MVLKIKESTSKTVGLALLLETLTGRKSIMVKKAVALLSFVSLLAGVNSAAAEDEDLAELLKEGPGAAEPAREITGSADRDKDTAPKDENEEDAESEEGKPHTTTVVPLKDLPPLPPDPSSPYREGIRFLKSQKYQEALDKFNECLKISPNYYDAWYGKALVYQLTGFDKFAARRYMELLKRRPDMDQARINLASLHRKHQNYEGAEDEYRLVIEHYFYNFAAHYNLANTLLEQKKFEEALKEYKVCLKLKPNNPMVHNNIGVIYLEKNYPDIARQEFQQASALEPANTMFQKNLNLAKQKIAEKQKSKTM